MAPSRLSQSEASRIVESCRYLARDPNVVSLGIGRKWRRGRQLDEIALVIGVRGKRALRGIPKGYRIPDTVEVSGMTLRTDVVRRRRSRIHAKGSQGTGTSFRIRARRGSEGTLGAFLSDQNGRQFILSCSHVLTDFGRASVLDHPIEDARSGRVIARLRRFVNLIPGADNMVDGALAEVTDAGLRQNVGLPRLNDVGDIHVNETVQIIDGQGGRTGVVHRIGIAKKAYGWAGHPDEYCWLVEQAEVADLGQRGDSGSLVLNAKGQAVGLYVIDDGAYDYMTPIARVLDVLADPTKCTAAVGDQDTLQLSWA